MDSIAPTRQAPAWIALATAPLVALMGGCAHDEPSAPIAGARGVALALSGLRALDPASEGRYEAWAVGSDGSITSAGRFDWTLDGHTVVTSPIQNPTDFMITVEPPGDDDAHPSPHKLLGGALLGSGVSGCTPVGSGPGSNRIPTPHALPAIPSSSASVRKAMSRCAPRFEGSASTRSITAACSG